MRMLLSVKRLKSETRKENEMSNYGKVIDGGARMTRGVTNGINGKLEGFSDSHSRSKMLAGAVGRAFDKNPVSEPHLNNVNGGKFTTPKVNKNR